MAAALAGVIHGCQGTDNHKSLTPALSRDAAAFGKFQSASAALAAAGECGSGFSSRWLLLHQQKLPLISHETIAN